MGDGDQATRAVVPDETRGVLRGGRVLAVVLLAASVWRGAGGGVVDGGSGQRPWLVAAVFGAVALVLWAVAVWGQRRALLGARLRPVVTPGNLAAALAQAANEVALAVLASRAVYGGALADLPAAVAFGALAVASWAVLVTLFRAVTTYPDGEEIAGENHAAAVSYAGAALALAVIIGYAVDGPFQGWGRSLRAYAGALSLALVLYPVRQLVVEGLLLGRRPRLRGGELDRAVGQQRNVGVAALEAAAYLATALLAVARS